MFFPTGGDKRGIRGELGGGQHDVYTYCEVSQRGGKLSVESWAMGSMTYTLIVRCLRAGVCYLLIVGPWAA